jgi:hypothetical protein
MVSDSSFRPFISLCRCRVESKSGRIRRVKYGAATLAVLAALSVSPALAEDFKTVNGKEYKNATVSHVEADGIVIKTKSGISKLYFVELPKEVQQRFGYDAEKLAQQAAERQKQQELADQQRQEKEKNAEADLKRVLEQFQVVEQRSAQAYQNATKGTVSGQVFVSTKGGENFKLGAVEVGLFARDAIDVLIAGIKKYADIQIQQVDAAKAERYYSGAFYFGYLGFPIHTAETDAEGKFVMEVPKSGRFVIAAQAERSVGKYTEHYYWLQPVSLEGQQQVTQNLSTNNLTSTTGSSSLIHTWD